MKTKLLISIVAIGISLSIYADDKPVKATLKEATVFFRGAELSHNASCQLVKGENQITIEGLSPTIDRNSLKIKTSNGVLVSAYEFSIDYLTENKNNDLWVKRLQDSIQYYKTKLQGIDIEIKVDDELSDILKKSTEKNISGSEKGLPIDDLIKTMDYYKKQKTELDRTAAINKQARTKYQDAITRLENQVKQESVKNNKTSGILKLSLSAPYAALCQLSISYYTPSANWVPFYDINIVSTDKPIKIAGKAKIRQMTGMDWNKVKLILSTTTPSNGKIAPLFSSWFLQERRPVQVYKDGVSQSSFSYDLSQRLAGQIANKQENPEIMKVRGMSSVGNGQPLYIVDGTAMTEEEFLALKIDPDLIDMNVMNNDSALVLYGSAAANGAIVITTKDQSMEKFISVDDNQLNMTYNIDLPFSVPGNGKEQSLDLRLTEVVAEYKYYCAPKLDTETYLLAEISNWQELNLLSGKANITYDGMYIGETLIDANSTQKKMTLTLGTDKRVVVKREKLRDFSSKKTFGSDVKQMFTYKITVRNNQNKPIQMVLKDQYPLSTQKNIEVELNEKDTTIPTAKNEEVGVLSWEETLNAGETKIYQISYSVKYPKNINLNL